MKTNLIRYLSYLKCRNHLELKAVAIVITLLMGCAPREQTALIVTPTFHQPKLKINKSAEYRRTHSVYESDGSPVYASDPR